MVNSPLGGSGVEAPFVIKINRGHAVAFREVVAGGGIIEKTAPIPHWLNHRETPADGVGLDLLSRTEFDKFTSLQRQCTEKFEFSPSYYPSGNPL
mmetsp:Transcript_35189/g.69358  ORF Transcript_35189/g.69358 Transcript_35189/m.69358 type:complete len:95 (+) Transcript_35189:215-499(+)